MGTIYLFSLGSIRKTFANAPAGDRFKMEFLSPDRHPNLPPTMVREEYLPCAGKIARSVLRVTVSRALVQNCVNLLGVVSTAPLDNDESVNHEFQS